jgi:hypothetical protein
VTSQADELADVLAFLWWQIGVSSPVDHPEQAVRLVLRPGAEQQRVGVAGTPLPKRSPTGRRSRSGAGSRNVPSRWPVAGS